VQVAITLMLIMTMLGLGYRQLAFQILVDKGYIRLAFIVMTPVLIFFSLVMLPKTKDELLWSHTNVE
jgi:hypothetical protein